MKGAVFLLLVLGCLWGGAAHAQAPQLINYQGRLLNGTNLVNGSVGLSLRLFRSEMGGTALYEDSNTVIVVDGLYSTYIGDNPTNGAFIAALTNAEVWIETAVNGQTLTPRERLASVGYSLATRGLLVTTNGSVVHNPNDNTTGDDSFYAAIGGGLGNRNNSPAGTIGGGYLNDLGIDTYYSIIGGGYSNSVKSPASYSIISGGAENTIESNASHSTIGGGRNNKAQRGATYATIGGGRHNVVGSNVSYSAIGGGYSNRNNSSYSTIDGGYGNSIGTNSDYSTINGGYNNVIASNSPYGMIGGGYNNKIGTNAPFSFAAGYSAAANHPGAFVWGGYYSGSIASTNENSVTFRAHGGFRIFTSVGVGAQLPPGSGSWVIMSDGNTKENYREVDGAQILDRIAALPVREWNYKTQADTIRHMGPTAQDFRAAFGLGESDTGIATVDADGVALAAIQALVKQNTQLQNDIEELRARLDAVENR